MQTFAEQLTVSDDCDPDRAHTQLPRVRSAEWAMLHPIELIVKRNVVKIALRICNESARG